MKKSLTLILVLLLLLSTTTGAFARAIMVDNFGHTPEYYNKIAEGFFKPSVFVPMTEFRMEDLLKDFENVTIKEIATASNRFSDLSFHWGKNEVGTLTHLGVVNGFPDSTFRPNAPLQVDQFIKLVVEAMGFEVEQPIAGYWALNHLLIAYDEFLIREYYPRTRRCEETNTIIRYKVEGDFARNDIDRFKQPITRQEMAMIISRAMFHRKLTTSQLHWDCIGDDFLERSPFHYTELGIIKRDFVPDLDRADEKFHRYIANAYAFGLLKGRSSWGFEPTAHLTRAEGATVIARFFDEGLRDSIRPDLSDRRQVTIPSSLFARVNNTTEQMWFTLYQDPARLEVFNWIELLEANLDKTGGAYSMSDGGIGGWENWDSMRRDFADHMLFLGEFSISIDNEVNDNRRHHTVRFDRFDHEAWERHEYITKLFLRSVFDEDGFNEVWGAFIKAKGIARTGNVDISFNKIVNGRQVAITGNPSVLSINFTHIGELLEGRNFEMN
ncbi:MAG: S-layer homology domain-containing protein [Alkaliphilus sp.]